MNQLYWDEFLKYDAFLVDVPEIRAQAMQPIEDHVLTAITTYISRYYGFNVEEQVVSKYLHLGAMSNRVNRVRDALVALKWDGKPRLDKFFVDVAGADDTEYVRAITSKTFIGACARAFNPGCKLDTVLLLEGAQGAKKSTLLSLMGSVAGNEYCLYSKLQPGQKDTMQNVSLHWFVVIDEFDTLSKGDIAHLKAFITSEKDTFRSPYGIRPAPHKRQCVFMASINRSANEYLSDPTGNRRFWPLKISGIVDTSKALQLRGQIWAEAAYRYQQDERWWIDEASEPELAKAIQAEQQERVSEDVWEEETINWIKRQRTPFTINEVLRDVLKLDVKNMTRQVKTRIADILTRNGLEKFRESAGDRRYVYNPLELSDYQHPGFEVVQ